MAQTWTFMMSKPVADGPLVDCSGVPMALCRVFMGGAGPSRNFADNHHSWRCADPAVRSGQKHLDTMTNTCRVGPEHRGDFVRHDLSLGVHSQTGYLRNPRNALNELFHHRSPDETMGLIP